jgi:DnaJ-class molecular chaperone
MKDFYEVLGVPKTATEAQIKTAYRKMALEWHPDRNKSADATTRFKEINQAYEVLSDSKKRQSYDQFGHDAYTKSGGAGAPGGGYSYQQGPFSYSYSSGGGANPFEGMDFGGTDPFEIFEQFFGFQSPFGGGRGRQKAHPVYQVTIDFMDAVKGTEQSTTIEGKSKKIKIPAGVDDGMRIRFSDFDLLIHVRPSSYFKRENQDIYIEKTISFPMAVLGGVVEVPTLATPVKLKVQKGTKSGSVVRLKGQGIVYPNTKRYGDQYVIFTVQIPEKVSSKAKKLLEELRTEL